MLELERDEMLELERDKKLELERDIESQPPFRVLYEVCTADFTGTLQGGLIKLLILRLFLYLLTLTCSSQARYKR